MGSKKFLLDSNVLIAYFRAKDVHHTKAKNWLESLNAFGITDYTLLETATVLQIKEGKEAAEKALHFLIFNDEVEILRMTEEELGATVALFIRQNHGIAFVDASLLILAKERGYTLATFDKGIVKAGELLTR